MTQKRREYHLIDWGSEDCSPGHEYGGIRDYYLIHMISRGRGEYHCDGRRWTLGKGDAFLIFPGEKHLYKADGEEPWSYFWLGFQGDYRDILKAVGLEKNNPVLHYDSIDELNQIFKGITEPRIYKHPAEELENNGRLNMILGRILRQRHALQPVPQKSHTRKNNHVQSMETFIHEYYSTAIQVQDVIDFVQLERSYASRIFMDEKNRTIGQAIREQRFAKAKEYLQAGLSAKEAAYGCGFRDYNNFLKAFKKRTGMTPAAYKLEYS